jgi:hypothetical protein
MVPTTGTRLKMVFMVIPSQMDERRGREEKWRCNDGEMEVQSFADGFCRVVESENWWNREGGGVEELANPEIDAARGSEKRG